MVNKSNQQHREGRGTQQTSSSFSTGVSLQYGLNLVASRLSASIIQLSYRVKMRKI